MDALPTDPWTLGTVGGVLLVAIVVGFLYWSMSLLQEELTVAVEEARADSARYEDLITQNQALTARQDSVAQRVRIIQEIDGDRYTWPHIMDEVAKAIPDYTWLTELVQTASGEEIMFRIQGQAGNPFALAQFMENLEASLFIRNVDLLSSQQDVVRTGTGTQRVVNGFELEASFERPPVELLETVPLFEEETPAEGGTPGQAEAPGAEAAQPPPPDTARAPELSTPGGGL
jgi:Tfp pilus assembly protein PilN